ncbi:hypothetical protein [Pseudomonas guariconensis]|uniref:hypothetical protein n=1 Tax=Pseudomonas guariconensis TaxID=1288410 RepID=UPI00209B0EB1|nr:hypothetical protein [Pseudomonas guariconensis]MCO7620151.1 hypothetical protein [Pseudomonas guariconensis]
MQLSLKHAGIPFATFLLISAVFLLIQCYEVNLIRHYYIGCHFLYGLAFPLFFSYTPNPFVNKNERLPLRLLISKVRAVAPQEWPRAIVRSIQRDLQRGISWNPWVGAVLAVSFSICNEVVNDPITNSIPFTSAYGHLVADLLGVMTFLLIVRLIFHAQTDNPRSPAIESD